MEALLMQILSEKGTVTMLFFFVLGGIIYVIKWLGGQYLTLNKEHNLAFLNSFDKMVDRIGTLTESVLDGDRGHTKEHNNIIKVLDDKEAKNEEAHRKVVKMVAETDNNVKKNTHSIKILHSDIKEFHKKILAK